VQSLAATEAPPEPIAAAAEVTPQPSPSVAAIVQATLKKQAQPKPLAMPEEKAIEKGSDSLAQEPVTAPKVLKPSVKKTDAKAKMPIDLKKNAKPALKK